MATEIEVRVSANTDDCWRDTNSLDTFGTGGSEASAGRFNGPAPPSETIDIACGMKFNGITIPHGTNITVAYIQFKARINWTDGPVNTKFYGEDIGNANTFSTKANYDGRDRTAASVVWNGIGVWTAGNTYNTLSIKAIIQEIVDRPDWTPGNSLVIFWQDNGSGTTPQTYPTRGGYCHDSSSEGAPLLHIEYEPVPLPAFMTIIG